MVHCFISKRDGNTVTATPTLQFSNLFFQKSMNFYSKKWIAQPRRDLQLRYVWKLGMWATHFTMNSYLEKRGVKRVFFLWRPTWVTKNPFSLKLLDIWPSALEYSSIGPKYTSYVKEKYVHALVFILWTFENWKKAKNVTANKKILLYYRLEVRNV